MTSKTNGEWDSDARVGPIGFIRRRVFGALSRPLLRAAHQRNAPIRLLLGAATAVIWIALGGAAAVDHLRGARTETSAAAVAPAERWRTPIAVVADGVCVFRSGKPCDYDVSNVRIASAQTALASLAIMTLLFGFWTQLLGAAARALRAIGAGHVVITGGGTDAETLARNAARTKAVVLVRRDASTAEIDALGADGVAVVAGPPTDPAVLRDAGVRSASRIVAMSASDAQNIGVAAVAHTLRRRARPGDVLVRVEGQELRRFLPSHGKLRAADLISISETAARLLTLGPGFQEEAQARGQERVHVAIIGWDDAAIAIVARLFRLMWALPLDAPRVTVFAPDAELCAADFEARFPHARAEAVWRADIAFETYDWRRHADAWSPLRATEQTRGAFTAFIVSLATETDTLHAAAALAAHTGRDGPPIHVREDAEGTIGVALGTAEGVRVIPFGAPRDVLSAAALIDRSLDSAAQRLHAAYLDTCVLGQNPEAYERALREGATPLQWLRRRFSRSHAASGAEAALEGEFAALFGAAALARLRAKLARRLIREGKFAPRADRPAQRPWEALAEHHISGNRTGADHALVKLWRLGWRPARVGEKGVAPTVAPADVTPEDCEIEHKRWAADLLLSGWRLGPRDDVAQTHPDLIPYADFSPDALGPAITKDRDPWLAAPDIAAAMGATSFVRREEQAKR